MTMIEGHLSIDLPDSVPIWDVDPCDPAILSNPEPYFARLRAQGPFVHIPKYSVLACGRYGEAKEVFSDWERFVSSRGVGLQDFSLGNPWRPPSIILEVDTPDHTPTRRVMARAMSPRVMAGIADLLQEAAEGLIGNCCNAGPCNAIHALDRLPVAFRG